MNEILKTKTILYIEDDSTVLQNVSNILGAYFHFVYTALSAEDGCDIFESKTIDLILVDIELPGINGIEFIQRVREINSEIPIIIISAYTKTDYLLDSIDLKVEQYIVKPFTTKKLDLLLQKLYKYYTEDKIIVLNNDVKICQKDFTVCYGEIQNTLTPKEFIFLKFLARNSFINYLEIDNMWIGFTPSQDAIRSFIKKLRKKLPQDTIKNKQNAGYYV